MNYCEILQNHKYSIKLDEILHGNIMKTIYCRILLGISAIFICLGCQPATLTKIATFSPTETAKPIVTATMKPVTHATPSPVIAVPAEVLDGTTVIFWHPWDPTLAAVIASQIVDFNKT